MSAREKAIAVRFAVLAVVLLALLVHRVVTSVVDSFDSAGSRVVVRALEDGDCIRGLPETSGSQVDRVGCRTTHDARVVGRVGLSESAVSAGGQYAVAAGREACRTSFAAQYSAAPQAYWAAVPSELDYAAGDRVVICFSTT